MKELVVKVMVFAICAYNYAVETGYACNEVVLYDVLHTDAYGNELIEAYKAIGADKYYVSVNMHHADGELHCSMFPHAVQRDRKFYEMFLEELKPVFDRCAKKFYADEEPDVLDGYIASLLEGGCLLKEEAEYLTDARNRDEMRVLYNHVCDLMKEPVDPDYDDSCIVGDFLDFDEVFGSELSIRTSKYLEERYAKHDLNMVAGAFNNTAQSGYKSDKYTDTDKAQAEYINRTMQEYNKF